MDGAQAQYDKMTGTPVPRLVVSLGIPTTISMLVTNIYNMADTYFVSTLGTSASGATGVVFALMAIIQAFGFMLGHGAGSNISRQLGGKDIEDARRYASTSFFLSVLCGTAILALGFLFQDSLMRLLGSTESILPYARTYSTYILLAAPAMASSCVMNNILRYEGKAAFAMIGLTSGGVLNIFGDYVLITFAHMGIQGAGISTAVSQYISALILYIPFARGEVQSCLRLSCVTRKFSEVWNIIATGFPSMLRQGLNSVSVMALNQCAQPFGDAAIAAFSIVSRVLNFLFCVGLGLFQGFQPVSAFNYGAKKFSRVKEAVRFTLLFVFGLMVVAACFGYVFAERIIAAFRDDPEVIRIGVGALHFQAASMVFVPVSLCGNMLFQSTGKSGRASLLASFRSGLLYIPALLVLSQALGLLGIQMSQTVADVLSASITAPMILYFLHHLPPDGEG